MNGLYESYYIPHVLRRAQGREQRTRDEHGRKTSQPFSTFTFEIRKRKRKRTSRTRKRTRTHGISRISETNQFEQNYVENSIRNTDLYHQVVTPMFSLMLKFTKN